MNNINWACKSFPLKWEEDTIGTGTLQEGLRKTQLQLGWTSTATSPYSSFLPQQEGACFSAAHIGFLLPNVVSFHTPLFPKAVEPIMGCDPHLEGPHQSPGTSLVQGLIASLLYFIVYPGKVPSAPPLLDLPVLKHHWQEWCPGVTCSTYICFSCNGWRGHCCQPAPSPVGHSPACWRQVMLPLEIFWTPTLSWEHCHICEVAGAVGWQGWLSCCCWLLCRKQSSPVWTPARGSCLQNLCQHLLLPWQATVAGKSQLCVRRHHGTADKPLPSFQGPCLPLHLMMSAGRNTEQRDVLAQLEHTLRRLLDCSFGHDHSSETFSLFKSSLNFAR